MRTEKTRTEELLALGVFGSRSRLGERIARLLEREREFSPRVSRVRVAVSGVALLGCVIAGAIAPRWVAFGQTSQLRFAASSIRPAAPQPPGEQFMGLSPGPEGGLRARQVSLGFLVSYSYSGDGPRIPMEGMPAWASRDQYDVVATPEPGPTPPSKDQLREMIRNMLADRFKLVTHRETREMPVYALSVAKGGAKLRREWPQPAADPPGGFCDANRKPMCTWVMEQAPMATLAGLLGSLGRPVVDRTGLEGVFDFRLKYDARNCGDEPDCVALRDAVEDQLGLKIEESKGLVEVLVVDHAEKPDEN